MIETEIEQDCPFCNAEWGVCGHYDLMVQLEDEADADGFVIEAAPEVNDSYK
jgi:hypothetical protein